MRFGHNFWLEGPIDQRPTRLNSILQDHFRDTPLHHIWRAQICAKNTYLAIFGRVFEHRENRGSETRSTIFFAHLCQQGKIFRIHKKQIKNYFCLGDTTCWSWISCAAQFLRWNSKPVDGLLKCLKPMEPYRSTGLWSEFGLTQNLRIIPTSGKNPI